PHEECLTPPLFLKNIVESRVRNTVEQILAVPEIHVQVADSLIPVIPLPDRVVLNRPVAESKRVAPGDCRNCIVSVILGIIHILGIEKCICLCQQSLTVNGVAKELIGREVFYRPWIEELT